MDEIKRAYDAGEDVSYARWWSTVEGRRLVNRLTNFARRRGEPMSWHSVVAELKRHSPEIDTVRFFRDGIDRTGFVGANPRTGHIRASTLEDDLDLLHALCVAGSDVTPNGLLGERAPRSPAIAATLPSPPQKEEQARRRKLFHRLKKYTRERTGRATWTAVVESLVARHPDVDQTKLLSRAAYPITMEQVEEVVRDRHSRGLPLHSQAMMSTRPTQLIFKRARRAGWIWGEIIERVTGLDYRQIVRQGLTGAGRRGRLFAPDTHRVDRMGVHKKLRSHAEACVDDALCHAIGREYYERNHAHDVRYSLLATVPESDFASLVAEPAPYTLSGRGPGISADVVIWAPSGKVFVVEVSPALDDEEYPERRPRIEWKAKLAAAIGVRYASVTATNFKAVKEQIVPVLSFVGAEHA